jgi:hypothetical protein
MIYKGTYPVVNGWELGVVQDDQNFGQSKYFAYGALSKGSGSLSAGKIISFSDLNKWNHHVITFTNSILRYYLNGQLQDTRVVENPLLNNSNDIVIGGSINPVSGAYKRDFDDVAIWNRALTIEEIAKIYKGENF